MENASKALIIAGSILIAIVLISLAIFVITQARANIDGGLSGPELQTYNLKFTQYEGIQSGTAVRNLLQEVIASNAEQKHIDAGAFVTVKLGGTDLINTSVTKTSGIQSTARYDVSLSYTNGRVSVITLTKQ